MHACALRPIVSIFNASNVEDEDASSSTLVLFGGFCSVLDSSDSTSSTTQTLFVSSDRCGNEDAIFCRVSKYLYKSMHFVPYTTEGIEFKNTDNQDAADDLQYLRKEGADKGWPIGIFCLSQLLYQSWNAGRAATKARK